MNGALLQDGLTPEEDEAPGLLSVRSRMKELGCCVEIYRPTTVVIMESGVFLPCLDQFMLSPLVTWVGNAENSDFLPKTSISAYRSFILFVM